MKPNKSLLHWYGRLYHWGALYLPIMLMALLALGSWYLVRKNPVATPTLPATPKGRQVDYFMQQFSTVSYAPDGSVENAIAGDLLRHYSDDTLEVQAPQLTRQLAEGVSLQAQAARALSTEDGSQVELQGGVRITRTHPQEAPWQLTSEHIRVADKGNTITALAPVRVERGSNSFSANSMIYAQQQGTLTMQGRVRVALQN